MIYQSLDSLRSGDDDVAGTEYFTFIICLGARRDHTGGEKRHHAVAEEDVIVL